MTAHRDSVTSQQNAVAPGRRRLTAQSVSSRPRLPRNLLEGRDQRPALTGSRARAPTA